MSEAVVKTKIVAVGNSRGIRIPRTLLEQTGLEGEVVLRVLPTGLLVQPGRRARDGWAAAARELARDGADGLLDETDGLSDFDRDEWTWKGKL